MNSATRAESSALAMQTAETTTAWDRPYDWQDRVVIRATVIAFFFCLYIVLGGPL